jgi:hypothetical protein
MGTLVSELGPYAGQLAGDPRIYVDANMPSPLVSFMRTSLRWDVLYVIEHDDLRRARDGDHFRLARDLHRTLITLDRDYLDDRKFPPPESGGVVVLAAPDERGLLTLLGRLDRQVFRTPHAEARLWMPPLVGRKLHVHADGSGLVDVTPSSPQAR